MALNFNTQPYHDDFDENKNFHKILFKPGVSVQARELTQVQSILQDQIGKFGKFVLSDGSKVTGGRYFVDTNAKCLKLSNTGELSTDIQYFKGNYVVGQTSKCIGYITETDIINYFLVVKPIVNGATNFVSDEDLFIFDSKSIAISNSINFNIVPLYSTKLSSDSQIEIAGCFGDENSYEFTINSSAIEVGDVISIPSAANPYDIYVVTELVGNAKYRVNKTLDEAYVNITLVITKFASRDVMEIGFDDGVYFTNNTFVKALPQTVVPNIKTQYPSCVVGYEVTESIVDFIDDSSLLDPAQGSYNYTAPGADRYKIYLELVYKPFIGGEIQNLTSKKFIELLRIKNGVVIKDNTNPVLGELEKTLARQMYDHAGNFIVKEFNVSFHDSDFKDKQQKIKAEVSPGKAYILGHEFQQSFPTFFEIDKGRDTNSVLAYESSIAYGNYISIEKPTGSLLNPQVSARVELHSEKITGVNNSTFVAYAYVRNIRYVSDTEYHLYLYNITSSNISNVKSVVIPTSSTYSALTFSSNTKLVNNKTLLVDPQFNNLLFKFPYSNIASISNVVTSIDKFQTLSVVSNIATMHSGSLTRKFSSGTGILSTEEKNATFVVVTNTTNGGYTAGDYVDLTNVVIEITVTGSEYVATFTFTNGYTGQIGIKYSLDDISTNEKLKTEVINKVVQVLAKTESSSLKIADISQFNGVFTCPQASATYIGVWNSGTTYNQDNVVLIGSELYVSLNNSNINSRPSGTSSSWSKLTNVTNNYILNNGQTEMMYDHGSIIAKSNVDVKNVFVIFNYYTHSSSGEFFYYNSYQTDYSKVPTVKIKNTSYDLREYIDFRPRRTDNTNNIQFDNYSIPSTLFSGMQYDISYYLGRIDKLIINDTNKFQWLRGIPSYRNQIPPSDISNAMTLATIEIKPFTFSQKDITITYKKHRRYTMDDIGKLDYRLNNVEYYTSLNLVEKDVMSRNIYDSVVGTRMKNGFVVDPFAGFGVMSIAENYKNCSLDLAEQALRPAFETKYINSNVKDIKTLNERANIVSFPYIEDLLVSQKVATTTVNCNPFDVISYAGTLTLYPQSDIWVDVETRPVINVVNDDLAALAEALLTPGNVYDEWQTFYATHPYKAETSTHSTRIQDGKIYDVSSTQVVNSDVIETISSNVIPYARSIDINFKASHLSPLTRLYMYVNGRLVNGYITPKQNPKGTLSAINILNVGSGYNANNTSVSVVAANTTIGSVNLEITGSTISGAEFSSFGLGYPTSNTIASIVSGNGANAQISIITIPQLASDLYSDENGECSGILSLPNDDTLKFLSGELHLVICDNPNYNPSSALAKAEATFYSSGRKNTLQETITSIREPYIKFMGFEPPKRTDGARIVVLNNDDYYIRNDDYAYSIYKTGTIILPVYLNKAPNSAVIVTVSNASADQSSNTNYTISPSSLTFTSTDFSTRKNFILTYDLGNKLAENVDNSLFSFLEYYGTSDDSGYNFSGSKPNKVWEETIPTDGISYTRLNPITKRKPVPIPASITCSGISEKQESGRDEFYVIPHGEKLQEYLPITFQVQSSNNSICKVTGIYSYANNIVTNSDNITISNLEEFNAFKVQVTYYATGNSSTPIIASTISGNAYWNGITGNTVFTHISTPIPPPAPAIVVQSSTENPRYTDEDGKTSVIGIKLSTSPAANVTISGLSSSPNEGIITQKSEDGTTIVSGNTVTFTTSDWNQTKLLISTGQADSLIDGTVVYYANLTSTSANSLWTGLTTSVPIENRDTTKVAVVPGHIIYSYLNDVKQTSESGNTVTLLVTLDKAPLTPVIISAISNKETEGKVTANSVMTFTSTDYNVAKRVLVTGQNDNAADGLQNFAVSLNVTSTTDPAFSGIGNTAPLSNTDTPQVAGELVTSYVNGSQTSESGATVQINVKLSKAPTKDVLINVSSDTTSRGQVDKSSLTFTSVNWNTNQLITVTGQNDSINDNTIKPYNIVLKTTSDDPLFSNINGTTGTKVALTNLPLYTQKGNVKCIINGSNRTSENGGTVSLSVSLDRQPICDSVTVAVTRSDSTEANITTGSSLTFTKTNWNQAQSVIVTGISDGIDDNDVTYTVTCTATPSNTSTEPGYNSATVTLVNTDIDITVVQPKVYTYTSTYSVSASIGSNWVPGVNISRGVAKSAAGGGSRIEMGPAVGNGNYTFSFSNRSDTVIQASKDGTIVIKSSGWMDDDHGHDNSSVTQTWLNGYKEYLNTEIPKNRALAHVGFGYQRMILTPDSKSTWQQLSPLSPLDQDTRTYVKWVLAYELSSEGVQTLSNSPNHYEYQFNLFSLDAVLKDPNRYFKLNATKPDGGPIGLYGTAGMASTCVTIGRIKPSFNWGISVIETVTTFIDGVKQGSADNVVWSMPVGSTYGTGLLNAAAYSALRTYFDSVQPGSSGQLYYFGASNLINSSVISNATKSEISTLIAAQQRIVDAAITAGDSVFYQKQLAILNRYKQILAGK